MKNLLIALSVLLLVDAASAGIPQLNATCPGGIEVHADEGGPVYLNGAEAALKKFSDSYFEAKGAGVVVSISVNPDGSPSVTYTGKGGANGICSLAGSQAPAGEAGAAKPSGPEAVATAACLDAVAAKVGVPASQLEAIDVMSAEAGFGVRVKVPGADAPWSCLSDGKGNVQGASYTGKEG